MKMIKLSKASKMPCKSFSLPAGKACIGMLDDRGKVKEVCQGCYAMKGSYNWRVVKQVRQDNLDIVKNDLDSFESELLALLNSQTSNYFRWFDSGDIIDNDMLYAMINICKQTPDIKHWIPTKAYELLDQDLMKQLEELPNVTVRYSSPSIHGFYQSIHGSTVIQPNQVTKDSEVYRCPVGVDKDRKKCNDCRACWDSPKKIAYTYH